MLASPMDKERAFSATANVTPRKSAFYRSGPKIRGFGGNGQTPNIEILRMILIIGAE
jgi:hypothetical protein